MEENKEFKDWLRKVNLEIIGITGGITMHDLADWNYYDAYEDGLTPREAAEEVVMNDDVGAMFFDF